MGECTEIRYKGVKMVYTNIEGCSGESAIPVFQKVVQVAATYPNKSMLSLVNAKGTRFNSDLLSVIRDTVKKNNPKVKATAVFGLNTLSTLMVNSIISVTGRRMKLLNSQEEAQEWLYQQEVNTRSAAA